MRPVADVVRRRSLLPTESIARKDAGDDKEREREGSRRVTRACKGQGKIVWEYASGLE